MGKAVFGGVGLPLAVLVEAKSVFSGGPDAIAVDKYVEDVIVGEAVGGGEVLPKEGGEVLREHQRGKDGEHR